MTKHSWITFSVLFLLACGPAAAPAEEEGGEEGTAGGEGGGGADAELRAAIQQMVVPPETPWSEMSHDDKGNDMVMRFEPVFRVMFQDFEGEHYGDFGCPTCHGEDADARDYHMPTSHLPPVPLAGTPAYQQMASEHPEDTRFMEEQVLPTMQTMLGMGATFTCNGCHPTAQ